MLPSLLILFKLITTALSAFPPSLRYPIPVTFNKINDISTTCDSNSFNITARLDQPFKGIVFTKDFAQECKSVGSLSTTVSISLPTSGCGVRLSTKSNEDGTVRMYYSAILVVQQDRHLRQIADQERLVQCLVDDRAFAVKSRNMAEVLQSKKTKRVGRMRKHEGWSKEFDEIGEELNETLSAARAWMEITPAEDKNGYSSIQVGDVAVLTVKSTLPVGIGWKIVDCFAHDGLGDSSQKLLDEKGCPIDELILPTPKYSLIRNIASMRHQEATSKFAAFKFPDRDRLHLSCGLQLCRGHCLQEECEPGKDNRIGRIFQKGDEGEILDRLEVFNSVEVSAPAIDDLRSSERYPNGEPNTYPFTNLPGDRTFCVSPDKMAIAFCILGLIFLLAVVVAACALLRARRTGINMPYYTRSLFSSTSGESGFGSKLLLHESPCLGQSSNSRPMQYGRIL